MVDVVQDYLNRKGEEYWLGQAGSPKAKRDEKPQGKTVPYEKSLELILTL